MSEEKEIRYSIGELAKAAGTTPRTIRFYQAEGLLPSAETRGRYSTYGTEHLDRLKVIQQLKRAYLPLSAIRAQIDRLSAEQIRLLSEHDVHVIPQDAVDAADYVSKLVEARTPKGVEAGTKPRRALLVGGARKAEVESESWKRFRVADGLELHAREGAMPEEALEECLRSLAKALAR